MLKDVKDLGLSAEIVRLEMAKSDVEFHLTGSRRFGTRDAQHSDWNFFASNGKHVVELLKSLGFKDEGLRAAVNTMALHGVHCYHQFGFKQELPAGSGKSTSIKVYLVDPEEERRMVDACKYLDGFFALQRLTQRKDGKVGQVAWKLLMQRVHSDHLAQDMIRKKDALGKNRDMWVNRYDNVRKEADQAKSEILGLEEKIEDLEEKIEYFEAQISNYTDQVVQLEKKIEDFEDDLQIRDEKIANLEAHNSKLFSATLERDQLKVERDQLLRTLDEMEERVQGEKHVTDCAFEANAALIRDASAHQAELEAAKVRIDCLEISLKDAEQERDDLHSSLQTETGARQDLTNKVFKVRLAAIIGHVIVGATSAYYPEVWAFVCKYGQPVVDYIYTSSIFA